MDKDRIYNEEYIPYCVKWGSATSLLGALLSFAPIAVLSFVYKVIPPFEAIMAAALIRVSACFVYYFIEPIAFQPVLGIPGTYMAFLAGNISNLRVPCSSIAQQAAGVEEGSPEGSVCSTVGVAVSVLVNTAILTIGVFLGASVLGKLPPAVLDALNYMVPALFGAMLIQMIMYAPKLAVLSVPLAILTLELSNRGVFPAYMAILFNVFGTVLLGRFAKKKGFIK